MALDVARGGIYRSLMTTITFLMHITVICINMLQKIL